MHEDDDLLSGTLELLVDARQQEDDRKKLVAEQAEVARGQADAARMALAALAEPAVYVIQGRLRGDDVCREGRKLTDEREDTAWEILSRIGVPKLRATAVAASISAHTNAPAPGAPGWVDPDDQEDAMDLELDPASVDAQIESFLAGARAAKDLKGES